MPALQINQLLLREIYKDRCLLSYRKKTSLKSSIEQRFDPGGGTRYIPGCAPHTLTLFKTDIADFPTLFKTEFRFLIPCLRQIKSCGYKLRGFLVV